MKLLITGATGLVGRAFIEDIFVNTDWKISVLCRDIESAKKKLHDLPLTYFEWKFPLLEEPPKEALTGVTHVLHLQGEPVAEGYWTREKKERIRSSRIEATKNLVAGLNQHASETLTKFVSASGIGYYGDAGEVELDESSPLGNDFLAEVCRDWEAASVGLPPTASRVICRIGMVLSSEGGALDKISPIFDLGLGGNLGSGKQWVSWIHINDLVEVLKKSLSESTYQDIINCVAPGSVRNETMTDLMGGALKRPTIAPAPAFALKTLLGEKSVIVLASQKVAPKKLKSLKFEFQFSEMKEALENICELTRSSKKRFRQLQFLLKERGEVFDFFTDEKNLEKLTPAEFNFKVVGKNTEKIEEGTLIDYRLNIHGVPIKWRSKIGDWNPPEGFSDEQVWGPLRMWFHRHCFLEIRGGTLIVDDVVYKMPLRKVGDLLFGWKALRDIKKIFDFRREKIEHFL